MIQIARRLPMMNIGEGAMTHARQGVRAIARK
jgi:hypothetical protein